MKNYTLKELDDPRGTIYPTGVALATVRIIDCRPMTRADESAACCELYDRAEAWILSDVQTFVPFEVKGSLGIFNVYPPEWLPKATWDILNLV